MWQLCPTAFVNVSTRERLHLSSRTRSCALGDEQQLRTLAQGRLGLAVILRTWQPVSDCLRKRFPQERSLEQSDAQPRSGPTTNQV